VGRDGMTRATCGRATIVTPRVAENAAMVVRGRAGGCDNAGGLNAAARPMKRHRFRHPRRLRHFKRTPYIGDLKPAAAAMSARTFTSVGGCSGHEERAARRRATCMATASPSPARRRRETGGGVDFPQASQDVVRTRQQSAAPTGAWSGCAATWRRRARSEVAGMRSCNSPAGPMLDCDGGRYKGGSRRDYRKARCW